jgi:hypothetical protein
MMRRFQVVTAAKAPKAAGMQAMQSAAAVHVADRHSTHIGALTRLPRGQLARAGDTLLALQREYGNHYVQRVVSQAWTAPVVQAKRTVGPAGHRYEREADRVARQVVHGAPQGRAATVSSRNGRDGQAAATGVGQAIQRERGRGRALPERLRSRMEQAMGANFRGVRLHNDAQADQLNRVLRARAFTTGQDVFLRRGEADLSTHSGRELIAHELTHVVQQAGGAPVIQCKLVQIAGDPDHLEDDKTGIKARLKTGTTDLYVGDHDGQDYKIELATNGEQTFALNNPVTGFFISSAPMTFTLGQQTTGQQTTGQQTTAPQTTAQPTLPTWNPPPISNPWTSPRGGTTYSFSPSRDHPYRRGAPSGKYATKPRRKAAGYDNPDQFHTNMLPLWKAAALSPIPTTVTDDTSLRKWLKDDDRRLQVTSPGRSRTKVIKGYKDSGTRSAVVLGHQPSAGSHFNLTGHTQPRPQNLSHNKSTGAYHALEDASWSAASGSSEPPYESPRPDRGSDPTFYNPSTTGFTGGPWHSYALESDQAMIGYIEDKLNAVASTAGSDPEYQQAVTELGKLKTSFSATAARGLLGMIQKKGW